MEESEQERIRRQNNDRDGHRNEKINDDRLNETKFVKKADEPMARNGEGDV